MQMRRSLALVTGLSLLALLAWRTGLLGFADALFLPKEYVDACKAAGVRFFRAPKVPVKSVALDYSPRSASVARRRYEFSSGQRVEIVGSLFWQPRVEQQVERFDLRSPFIPERPDWEFYRFQGEGAPTSVSSMSADVLVMDTVSHSDELQNALWQQGMVEHHLKATDLRNGDELADMIYVVDLKNRRACGENAKRAIDVDLFILQAIAVPIVIPEYERKRREGATVKNW